MKTIIILLLFLSFYFEIFPKQTQIVNINYEHSQLLDKSLINIKDLSVSYSQWQIQEYSRTPLIFIKFSFGSFDSSENIKENHHLALAYEQLYNKKINSFVTQNFLLGLSYDIFDFNYNELVTYDNSQFTGDSIHALKLYLTYGFDFQITRNTSITLSFIPQLYLFRDNTERSLENSIMSTNLATGYNLGLSHKF